MPEAVELPQVEEPITEPANEPAFVPEPEGEPAQEPSAKPEAPTFDKVRQAMEQRIANLERQLELRERQTRREPEPEPEPEDPLAGLSPQILADPDMAVLVKHNRALQSRLDALESVTGRTVAVADEVREQKVYATAEAMFGVKDQDAIRSTVRDIFDKLPGDRNNIGDREAMIASLLAAAIVAKNSPPPSQPVTTNTPRPPKAPPVDPGRGGGPSAMKPGPNGRPKTYDDVLRTWNQSGRLGRLLTRG